MAAARTCPRCGTALPEDALGGLCPKCLGAVVFGIPVNQPQASPADTPPSSVPAPAPGTKVRYFGDYELLEEIAHGGMGVVYRARQVSLNRTVAVKMILAGPFATEEFIKRFQAEAEAAANLQHPNIVAIHEVGVHEGLHYFSMDYVEGRSLASLVRDGPLSAARAARYVQVVAEAIHYAHQHGILHRDLKPSNVLIDAADQPRITDFGLAKRLVVPPSGGPQTARPAEAGTPNDLTLSGQVLGSPGYLPPEQATGHRGEVGPQSDVYSLGAILYCLLTGRAPFQGETVTDVLEQVLNTEPLAPRMLNPSITRDLETICLKCLEKGIPQRYATAQALAEELRRFLQDEPIQARPISRAEKVWRWCRRKPALAGLSAAVTVLAVFVLIAAPLVAVYQAKLRGVAEAYAKEAQTNAAASLERLVRLNVANGSRLLEEGDHLGSLAWFGEALNLDRGRPEHEAIHRLRIASIMNQSPKLLHWWFHGGRVNSAEFSKDGRQIVTASDDQTARVWDVASGQPVTGLLRHAGKVNSASFSPDGQRVLTGGDDNVRLWDARTGELQLTLGHKRASAAFSPDGRLAITVGADYAIRLWDSATAREVAPALKHSGEIASAVFSPDGQRLLTSSMDKSACVWEVKTGQRMLKLAHDSRLLHAAFSPDGTRIATAEWAGFAHLWDATTGRPVTPPLFHDGMVSHVTFSPDGKWVVTSGWHGAAKIWDIATGELIRTITEAKKLVLESAFSSDGRQLLLRLYNGQVRAWSVHDGQPASPFLHHSWWPTGAAFHPDGRRVLSACADGSVRLVDLLPDGLQFWPWGPEPMTIVNCLPNGSRLVTESASGRLQVWEAGTWQSNRLALALPNGVLQALFSIDGQRVLTVEPPQAGTNAGGAFVPFKTWDLASGRLLLHTSVALPLSGGRMHLFAAGPDCVHVAFATSKAVEAWDLAHNKSLWRFAPSDTNFKFIHFSPDGRRVAFNSRRLLHVLEVATGQEAYPPLTNKLAVYSAAFSPDGRQIVTTCSDVSYENGEARIWDVATGKLLLALEHSDGVKCAAFSSDGNRLATGGEFKTARVFEVKTGRALAPHMRHPGAVSAIAFSLDGRMLATGSADFTARVWDSSTGEPLTLPLAHSNQVLQVCFLAGDQYLATQTTESFFLWKLPRSQRPSEDLVSLARLAAAHRIDPTGVMEPLDLSTLSNAWNSLHGRAPNDFLFEPQKALRLPAMPMRAVRPLLSIPPRDPQTQPNLIDLSRFYNVALQEDLQDAVGNNLVALPRGAQRLAQVEFDLRGVIQLSSTELAKTTSKRYTSSVIGLPVNRRATRLHVLHGTAWTEPAGTKIGVYRLHYADGQQAELPIVYGEDVRDWWCFRAEDTNTTTHAIVAWTGENPNIKRRTGGFLRLYQRTYENPRPDVEVKTIDFVSTMTKCALFLIALTVE